jgi:hypothetical protein
MSDLASILMAAVLSVAKGKAAEEPERMKAIASDIAFAVEKLDRPVFPGEGGKIGLGLMLVAIAKHESEFEGRVDDCSRRGDFGRSITIFQLLRGPNWQGHRAEAICSDRRLAATLALGLLTRPLDRFRQPTPQMLANAYATGSPGTETRAAHDICKLWEKLTAGAGLRGATCGVNRALGAPGGSGSAARDPQK